MHYSKRRGAHPFIAIIVSTKMPFLFLLCRIVICLVDKKERNKPVLSRRYIVNMDRVLEEESAIPVESNRRNVYETFWPDCDNSIDRLRKTVSSSKQTANFALTNLYSICDFFFYYRVFMTDRSKNVHVRKLGGRSKRGEPLFFYGPIEEKPIPLTDRLNTSTFRWVLFPSFSINLTFRRKPRASNAGHWDANCLLQANCGGMGNETFCQ